MSERHWNLVHKVFVFVAHKTIKYMISFLKTDIHFVSE